MECGMWKVKGGRRKESGELEGKEDADGGGTAVDDG